MPELTVRELGTEELGDAVVLLERALRAVHLLGHGVGSARLVQRNGLDTGGGGRAAERLGSEVLGGLSSAAASRLPGNIPRRGGACGGRTR
jgi:hypothetical protein